MITYEEIVKKYLEELNEHEKLFLNYKQKHGEYPSPKEANDYVIVDSGTMIEEGMILLRKHHRFCYVQRHSHNYLEINYVMSGKIEQIIDNTKITLNKGDLLFISKDSIHQFYPAEKEDLLLNFIILPSFFDFIFPFIDRQGNIKQFLIDLFSGDGKNNSMVFRVGNDEVLQRIIKNIIVTYHESKEGNMNLLRNYFLILIYELLKRAHLIEEIVSSNYDSILLFKIYNYIENNYTNGSLEELAKLLNEDYIYLSKKIKKITGFTFKELIEEERIKAAKSLLEFTDVSIEVIANHIGYNNITFFYNLFKKHVGCTPQEYRKKIKSNKKQTK